MATKKKINKNSSDALAINKKAFYNFEIVEKFEAGLSLVGTEVKSLRQGKVDLAGAYARIIGQECFLVNVNIATYDNASYDNHEPLRKRKLLLHKNEIKKIIIKLEQRGFTLVPLKMYFNSRGFAKVQLGLACGKKLHDKRHSIAKRQQARDMDRIHKAYKRR